VCCLARAYVGTVRPLWLRTVAAAFLCMLRVSLCVHALGVWWNTTHSLYLLIHLLMHVAQCRVFPSLGPLNGTPGVLCMHHSKISSWFHSQLAAGKALSYHQCAWLRPGCKIWEVTSTRRIHTALQSFGHFLCICEGVLLPACRIQAVRTGCAGVVICSVAWCAASGVDQFEC
jgi:hypothetical protein